MAEINSSINKGVPIDTQVTIRSVDLLSLCSDPEYARSKINKKFQKYLEFLHSLAKFPDDIEFMQTLCVGVDKETLDKKIFFSYGGFVSSIAYYLNYENVAKVHSEKEFKKFDDEIVFDIFLEKIEKLRQIDSSKKLSKEFPIIYNYYERYESVYNDIIKIKNKISTKSEVEKFKIYKSLIDSLDEENKEFVTEIYNHPENFSLKKIITELATALETLINKRDEVLQFLYSYPISLKYIDVNEKQMDLYMAYQHQIHAELFPNPQKYLYYVSTYFFENKDLINSDYSIKFGNTDYVKNIYQVNSAGVFEEVNLSVKDLYKRYRNFLIQNPELRAIHLNREDFENMNLEEVEKFMNEYLIDLQANWDFLENDDKDEIYKSGNIGTENRCNNVESKEHRDERLSNLLYEKKSFYDSTKPVCRLKGKNTFDGYLAFVYDNGLVVLDKFYEDAEKRLIADGHAIYVMNIDDFYTLSKLSKSKLIRDKLCKRFVHKGNWQDKLKEEIEKVGKNSASDSAIKKLMKLKENNNGKIY